MRPYLEAKLEADTELAASGLDYTIVRPGGLTDDPGTGMVEVAAAAGAVRPYPPRRRRRDAPRLPGRAGTIGKSFDLVSGETPIAEAIAGL